MGQAVMADAIFWFCVHTAQTYDLQKRYNMKDVHVEGHHYSADLQVRGGDAVCSNWES
jgi:hypothetical protein